MKLEYEYMDSKTVKVSVAKSEFCDGYNVIERIIEFHDQGQFVAGPYSTKREALIAGEKYVKSITGQQ